MLISLLISKIIILFEIIKLFLIIFINIIHNSVFSLFDINSIRNFIQLFIYNYIYLIFWITLMRLFLFFEENLYFHENFIYHIQMIFVIIYNHTNFWNFESLLKKKWSIINTEFFNQKYRIQ